MKNQVEYESEMQEEGEDYADEWELERQVMLAEWGPILALPVKTRHGWVQPTIDEDGRVEWGAFGTVDFSRLVPEFDKARYKAARLREEKRDESIMISILSERLPKARYKVLKYVIAGVLDIDDIENEDMRELARRYLRAMRLEREIAELEGASWARRKQRKGAVLG